MLIVRTQIKELIREKGQINNLSEDFLEKLEKKVEKLVLEACQRAKENNRKTVMGKDV